MPQRRFPRPWRFELIPGGYCVVDGNGLTLAYVYGQPPDAVARRLRRHNATAQWWGCSQRLIHPISTIEEGHHEGVVVVA
jgi:hypothetical protein